MMRRWTDGMIDDYHYQPRWNALNRR